MRYLIFLLSLSILTACGPVNPPIKNPLKPQSDLPIDRISLPDGFKIEVFVDSLENARSLCYSPNGTLFVGTRGEGKVYALRDTDGDFVADERYTLAEDLEMPNGVAFRDGDLYVAEVSRILKFTDIENKLDNPGAPEVVYDQFPTERHHGWKYIAFGPDGKLYVPVGAPCNICESEDEVFASITRMNPDGTNLEVVQHGVRNTVGFTWHPEDQQLWFTDNGRDMLGDDIPACELNHASSDGEHFGYPYCHQGDLPDEEFGEGKDCADYKAPVQNLGAHVAPLGVEFYTADMFPADYKMRVLIAEHGSWNRSKKSGYRITQVVLDENQNAVSYTPFAEGWLDEEEDDAWGRPVDLEFLPDGSMLVSDDFANAIYRISYEG